MNPLLDAIQGMSVTFAIVFACVGLGFWGLRQRMKSEAGPGYWVCGLVGNALGFLFWSGSLPLPLPRAFLIGEVFHVVGFWLLVIGAYRFTGHPFRFWNGVVLGLWTAVWVVAIGLFSRETVVAMFLLKALRAVLFLSSGTLLLLAARREKAVGIPVAGLGLIAWGAAIAVSGVVPVLPEINYGLLIGSQLVACLGMVAMVLDKMRLRAEESEEQIRTLEGLLPICSYCKKIRDEKDQWHRIEAYIENRSRAEFTHGICPDCFAKHAKSSD